MKTSFHHEEGQTQNRHRASRLRGQPLVMCPPTSCQHGGGARTSSQYEPPQYSGGWTPPPQAAGLNCPQALPRTPPPRSFVPSQQLVSPPHPRRVTTSPYLRYERIGDPALQVYRLRLPRDLIGRLDGIVQQSEWYANQLPTGWKTDLYSLTKQDLTLRDVPGMHQRIRPIYEYIAHAIKVLFGCARVVVDRNQPHVLKYSVESGHKGVELHHDRCDVTANLVLSKSSQYSGGGTLIPEAIGKPLRLEQGEFLLHPGSLVHGGMDIQSGERYLMVIFAHLK